MGALTTTITATQKFGKMRCIIGYASESATVGDIKTGLSRIVFANIQEVVSQVNSPSMDITTTAGTITIDKAVGSGNVYFMALGY